MNTTANKSRQSLLMVGMLAFIASTSDALEVRSYNATDHKRFDPFPVGAQINTSHIYSSLDLTGIGYRTSSYPTRQCALVSRQYIVFATHYRSQLNSANIRFLNSSNIATNRTAGTQTVIQKSSTDSDLTIIKLNAPIDADSGISPLPYLNLATEANYTGQTLGVLGKESTGDATTGQFPLIGSGTLALAESTTRAAPVGISVDPSIFMSFEYGVSGGGLNDDDCYLEVGDSGSPTFVSTGGQAALVGVHSYVIQANFPPNSPIVNYDVFIPAYISELDAVMNPDGYRMRPLNADPTTLATTTTVVQATPRKAKPLDLEYELENTGTELTGNVEVEFQFNSGEGPDSITGPSGWVTYGSGDKWTLRKATYDASDLETLTATWATAPSVETLSITMVRRSDTTADDTLPLDIGLAPSFADWASGLVENGEEDDPDMDQLENVVEYALGGDPESGVLLFADGGPLTPQVSESSGTITLTFPERADKALRGLSYDLEFSDNLSGWSGTLPAGFNSSTAPYAPAVDGFVKRTCTWPAGSGTGFVRLAITLSE